MANHAGPTERVFKTAWFSKAARKSHIPDAQLCTAIRQVMLGQADDLGGGVFKKRLGKNQYRSMIVAKEGGIGYTPTSSPGRIKPISTTPNFVISVHWRRCSRRSPKLKLQPT